MHLFVRACVRLLACMCAGERAFVCLKKIKGTRMAQLTDSELHPGVVGFESKASGVLF